MAGTSVLFVRLLTGRQIWLQYSVGTNLHQVIRPQMLLNDFHLVLAKSCGKAQRVGLVDCFSGKTKPERHELWQLQVAVLEVAAKN